jgi:hypothetical protein
MLVDPGNPRLAAHFGKAVADHALEKGTDPDEARRARAEADFQAQRAVKLAPADDEVKTLRADVVKRLQLGSESPVLPAPPGRAAPAASAQAAASPSPSPAETPVEMTPVPEGGTDATPRAVVLPAPPRQPPPSPGRRGGAGAGRPGAAGRPARRLHPGCPRTQSARAA